MTPIQNEIPLSAWLGNEFQGMSLFSFCLGQKNMTKSIKYNKRARRTPTVVLSSRANSLIGLFELDLRGTDL